MKTAPTPTWRDTFAYVTDCEHRDSPIATGSAQADRWFGKGKWSLTSVQAELTDAADPLVHVTFDAIRDQPPAL